MGSGAPGVLHGARPYSVSAKRAGLGLGGLFRLGLGDSRHSINPLHSARRGDYRALYTVDEDRYVITVLAVAHRRDAYRPL